MPPESTHTIAEAAESCEARDASARIQKDLFGEPADDPGLLAEEVAGLARAARAGAPAGNLGALSRSSRILRESGRWFLVSDMVALHLAFVAGGLLAWAMGNFVFGTGFQELVSLASLQEFGMFVGLGLIAILWLDIKGHYRNRLPFWETVGHLVIVASAGLMLGGFLQFALKGDLSRLWLGLGWTFFGVFLFAGRALARRHLQARGRWNVPALLIGGGPTATAARGALQSEPGLGFEIKRHVPAARLDELIRPAAWRRLMVLHDASYLLLAMEGADLVRFQPALQAILRGQIPYSIVPPVLGFPTTSLAPHHFIMHDVTMLHDINRLRMPLPRLIKRSFDVLVSGTVLAVFVLPLLALAAVLKLEGGQAFYRQPRVGRRGRIFTCYKLRSMRPDAEAVLQRHLDDNPEAAAEWKRFQKLKDDPRITPIGVFIRNRSIDEMPQLFNVLMGDMSLVGPRPILPDQREFYEGDIGAYEAVLPGITGPWQVSGRNSLTFRQRVTLEVWYARNWSLWLDIIILLKTIPVLLKRDHAF